MQVSTVSLYTSRKLTRSKPKGSRMMPLPNLQICLQPRVTLTFDLQTQKVDRFIPLPVDQIYQLASKSLHSFLQCPVHEFNHRQTNGQINGRTDGPDGQIEIIMPPLAGLTWWRHKNSWDFFSEDGVSVTGYVCCVDVKILGILCMGAGTGEQGGQAPTLEKIRMGKAHPGNFRRGLKTFWQ